MAPHYPSDKLARLESKYTFVSDDIYYYNAHRPASIVKRLQNRTQEFDAQVVPEIFSHSLHEKIVTYEVSNYFGTGHIIVFVKTKSGKKLVLRATHALEEPEKYVELEQDIINRYKKAGVPSVEILASDASRRYFPFDYQIMLPLSGKDLELEWEGNQDQYDALSFELGKFIARQYQIPGEGWGRWKRDKDGTVRGAKSSHHAYLTAYLDHDLEVISLFDVIGDSGCKQLLEYFSSKNLQDLFKHTTPHFVHHDIADHNIRYSGSRILSLYDWENAVVFDPISDLGSAPTWKTHYPREQKLREGFVAELGFKPDNLDMKADVYFLRTMLWKTQFALKGQRLGSRHISLLEDAIKRNGLQIKINHTQVIS